MTSFVLRAAAGAVSHQSSRILGSLSLSSSLVAATTTATRTGGCCFRRGFARTTTATAAPGGEGSGGGFPTTPDVCDDFAGTVRVVDPALGFRNFGGAKRFGGRAVTVKCHEDNSMVKHLAKKESFDGTGKVIVVDGGGSMRRALLGDMVASGCLAAGWEGLVIYGCIRDVDEVAGLAGLGVQALGSHPIPTTKRNEGQIDVPVTFGGVTIRPGDWIVCDNNGIVVTDTDPRRKRQESAEEER